MKFYVGLSFSLTKCLQQKKTIKVVNVHFLHSQFSQDTSATNHGHGIHLGLFPSLSHTTCMAKTWRHCTWFSLTFFLAYTASKKLVVLPLSFSLHHCPKLLLLSRSQLPSLLVIWNDMTNFVVDTKFITTLSNCAMGVTVSLRMQMILMFVAFGLGLVTCIACGFRGPRGSGRDILPLHPQCIHPFVFWSQHLWYQLLLSR